MFKHTSILAAALLALGVGCGSLGGGPLIELEKRGDGLTYRKGDPAPYTGQMIMTTRGTNEKWVSNFKEASGEWAARLGTCLSLWFKGWSLLFFALLIN